MEPIAMAFPVLPGKSEKARQFMKSLKTEHARDFAALEKKLETTKEAVFLQSSPGGDMIIDYYECAHPQKSAKALAELKDKFAVWMKSEISDITGVDVEAMAKEPMPEQVLLFGF
jgi:flagellar motility protein MotE (MotC chaperone)